MSQIIHDTGPVTNNIGQRGRFILLWVEESEQEPERCDATRVRYGVTQRCKREPHPYNVNHRWV